MAASHFCTSPMLLFVKGVPMCKRAGDVCKWFKENVLGTVCRVILLDELLSWEGGFCVFARTVFIVD